MSINLTRKLQNPSSTNTLIAGSAGRTAGTFLTDTTSITWTEDEFGNVMATALSGGGIAVVTHLVGLGPSPVAAAGSAAGGGTANVIAGATDLSGYITITTGDAPVGSATLAMLSFNTLYGAPPKVVLTPANAAAQGAVGLAAPAVYQANINDSGFLITQGSTALQPDTTYVWGYLCTQ
jgi:xanthine/CO dehydrogenase XdhC/CoxF family maturation factor